MRLFVSYSRANKAEVGKVVDLLRSSGHEVWWDGDIPIMADWWATILKNIEWCEVFIFVTSEKSVQSAYCRAEIKYANDRQRPILPFMLDNYREYNLPPELPPRNQYLIYDGDPERMLEQINRAYANIDWNLHKDINAQRPPEPVKGGTSLAKQFQEARRLAEVQKFEEAKQLFRNIKSLDYGEWGTECDEWLARLTSYEPIVDLISDDATLDRARREWSRHVRDYGAEFDPVQVRARLKTGKPARRPLPVTAIGAVVAVLALALVGISFATGNLRLPSFATPTLNAEQQAALALAATEQAQIALILTEFWQSTATLLALTPSPTSTPTPSATATVDVTGTAQVVETQAVATLFAQATNDALATENAPTNTPAPTATTAPSPTATTTAIASPITLPNTWTPTPDPTQISLQEATALANAQATVAAQPSPTTEQSTRVSTGVVALGASANVRQSPSTDSSVVASLPAGTRFEILGSNAAGDWTNVRLDDGRTGWIANFLMLTATPLPTPTITPTLIAETQTAIAAGIPGYVPITRNADWTPVTQNFDGVPMVLVPAGCFMMGSNDGQDDEQPVHEQCFEEPFWIDETEVTQADFERRGGQKANPNRFDGDQRPVERITWFEARDFCAQRGARLPTEREWEYAARGPDNLVYPWGSTWNENNAVFSGNSNNQTANVGSRPVGASWVGAVDMSGNVWEWTSTLYEPYPYLATDGREDDTGDRTDVRRVLRGGSFVNTSFDLRAPSRLGLAPNFVSEDFGFRCARSS
jgi:formylglycine-generating enzyme required for sulfatase activity